MLKHQTTEPVPEERKVKDQDSGSDAKDLGVQSSEPKPTPELKVSAERIVHQLVRHCADTYQGCCLPYKTPVMPNGWCVCNCGDCRVAKYQAMEKANDEQ